MSAPLKVLVFGEYALFTRPEMKVERVSYDVITPSAARGVLEAIYWKPQIRYVIERLHILKPIRFTNIRRNEVDSKVSSANVKKAMKGTGASPLSIVIEDSRQQRAATILRDVAYVIEARFELVDPSETIEKHYNCLKRRAERGQCFHRPYLGCREFACDFEWVDGPIPESELTGTQDLGYMLHDIEYLPATGKGQDTISAHTGERLNTVPHFFRAEMNNGIIEVPELERTQTGGAS